MRIKYGKEFHNIDLSIDNNVGNIKKNLAEKMKLRADSVRLINAGKVLGDDEVITEQEDKQYMNVVMMATPLGKKIEDDTPQHMKVRLVDDLTKKPKRAGASGKKLSLSDSYFGNITPLEGLPMRDKAYSILLSLATDPGIVAVMKKHGWNVPTLAELYPEGEVGVSEVCVLGLNENKGQRILLRIRTDDLEGFRRYESMKQVLIHELTHNVWGDHDSNFYMLMRQLQKEAVDLDWNKSRGRRTNGVSGKVEEYTGDYSDEDEDLDQRAPRTLDESNDGDSVFKLLPARMMAGQAALLRLTKEEQEVQDGCPGTQWAVNQSDGADVMCLPCSDQDPEKQIVELTPAGGEIDCGDKDDQAMATDEKEGEGEGEEKGLVVPSAEEAPARSATLVDGIVIRQSVLSLCDEAVAMSQQYSQSAYAADKLSTLSSLLLALLSPPQSQHQRRDDGDQGGEPADWFIKVCECLSLVLKILGNARDPTKRSINKASKAVRSLEDLPSGAGLGLLLCLGFTEAETEGRLVMRLYDESFAYIVTDITSRALSICQEALTGAQGG